jgi:hypothetical protein
MQTAKKLKPFFIMALSAHNEKNQYSCRRNARVNGKKRAVL